MIFVWKRTTDSEGILTRHVDSTFHYSYIEISTVLISILFLRLSIEEKDVIKELKEKKNAHGQCCVEEETVYICLCDTSTHTAGIALFVTNAFSTNNPVGLFARDIYLASVAWESREKKNLWKMTWIMSRKAIWTVTTIHIIWTISVGYNFSFYIELVISLNHFLFEKSTRHTFLESKYIVHG